MQTQIDISATIVLYKENEEVLQKSIASFLQIPLRKKLYLIDNSPTQRLKKLATHPEIDYHFIGKNIGFAKANNLVLKWIKKQSDFHLILNPDVVFEPNVVLNLIQVMQKDSNVAMISPKVLYPNGDMQYTCRKFPSIFDLINRRLKLSKAKIRTATYGDLNLSRPFYPDFIHGCFMLFRTTDLIAIKGFDERYFLYMEDVDICRKIDALGKKKLYYPNEKIVHVLQQGSTKNIKLFFIHIVSAIKYFRKWKKS